MTNKTYCGYVALIGQPNVGKSTLLNKILQQKISITSRKAQTTRHKILGIVTDGDVQTIFVDTPGLHLDGKHELNRQLNREALAAVVDVDVIVFIVAGLSWSKEDRWILEKLQAAKRPIVLVINKVDKVKNKELLLPFLKDISAKENFAAIVPSSALKGKNITELQHEIAKLLPESEHYFAADQITDRNVRFLAAEIVREKLFRFLGDEVPYATSVGVEKFEEQEQLVKIHCVIWVARDGQKAIVIGKGGEKLKQISTLARQDIEKLVGKKVFLKVWVKVKENWSNDAVLVRSLLDDH